MRTIIWILVIILGLALLLVIPGLFMFFPGMMGGFGGMMGGYGMMGRGFGFAPFGMLMWLIPACALVLLVAGAVGLVTALFRSQPSSPPPAPIVSPAPATSQAQAVSQAPAPAALACPNCGKPIQADWNTCPYCGTGLK